MAHKIRAMSIVGPIYQWNAASIYSGSLPANVPRFDLAARYRPNLGLVTSPNIDLAGEMISHLQGRKNQLAVAQALSADPKMIQALLDTYA
jgi:hypothetical protein